MCIAAQIILAVGVAVSLVEAALVVPCVIGAVSVSKHGSNLSDAEDDLIDAVSDL